MVVDENPPTEMRDDFGEKPEMVTKTQWTALKNLHVKLAHPAVTSLQRMLRRAGARPEVIAAVPHLDRAVCKELVRPHSERKAAIKENEDQAFNTDVYMDDLEVVLTDGSRQMCKAMIDERTALGVLIPMEASRIVGAEETCRAVEEHWISWAGPPKRLHYDLSRGQQAEAVEQMARRHGVHLVPVPAEAWKQKGKIEKRIELYKHHFTKLNHEVGLTARDRPSTWTTRLSWVANTHLRVDGVLSVSGSVWERPEDSDRPDV